MDDRTKVPPPRLDTSLVSRLQAISSAFLAITSELDTERVLQSIADAAREVGQAAYAALGVVDDAGVITSFITSGLSARQREEIGEPPRGHGLLGVLIRQGQPLRVPDMAKDPRSGGFPPHHPAMTSLLGMPISVGGTIVGNLYLTDKLNADEFSEEDEWWLTIFARQAAVAIQNANFYRETRRAQQRAQTLAHLISQLNQVVDPHQLFNQITEATCDLLELPAAALYLLNTDRSGFEFQAQRGLQPQAEHHSLPLEASVAGRVLRRGASLAVEDTTRLDKLFFLPLASGKMPGALLVVPIRHGAQGRVEGVIEVYAAGPRLFGPEEIALLEAFAGQAALALERARLYQHKEEFLSMTAHELRAPLAAIKLSAGLLESSLPASLPPALGQLATNITRSSARLNNLLDDLLDLTRLEQGRIQLRLERLEIGEAVSTALHTLAPLFTQKEQQVQLERPAIEYWVNADRARLEQVLVNLLSNANKYTPVGGQIGVNFRLEDGLGITVAVQDSGPGIPPDERELIFERYYRRAMHENVKEMTGSGLGLPIARVLVELLGGQLWAESDEDVGSRFLFRLPLC